MKNPPFFLYYQAFSALFGADFLLFLLSKMRRKMIENEVGT